MHQEPLLEAREPWFTMKLREPKVDDDHGCVAMHFPLLSLPSVSLPMSLSHSPSVCVEFGTQELWESFVGVAARPWRRSCSPSTLQTSPSQAIHAIVFHDTQAPSYSHSSIPMNPTVRFWPSSVAYAAAPPVYGSRRNPRS